MIAEMRKDPAVWESMMQDAGTAVSVVDHRDVLLACNETFARVVGAESVQSLIGRRSDEYLPTTMARELTATKAEVRRTGQPAAFRTVWHGQPFVGIFRRLAGGAGVIGTSRPESSAEAGAWAARGYRLVQSRFADQGPLKPLSDRERAVLSLIGAGLSTAQIAQTLGRSVKTIENQRHSLGRKLKVSNRVELARIALACGLSQPQQT